MNGKRHAPRALTFVFAAAAAAALAAATASAPRALAHKFHTSFTEANYNAEAGTLEVSLRTFPDDLAEAVRRRARGGRVPSGEVERRKAFEEAVAAYVGETFQLKTARGEPVKLSWVGMDAGADSAWLYFEAALPGGVEGAQLRSTFLADLFDDQVNLVNVRAGGRKASLRFERGGGFRRIEVK